MIYVAYTIIIVGSMALGTWLVLQGHPWFAVLVLLMGGMVSFSRGGKAQ